MSNTFSPNARGKLVLIGSQILPQHTVGMGRISGAPIIDPGKNREPGCNERSSRAIAQLLLGILHERQISCAIVQCPTRPKGWLRSLMKYGSHFHNGLGVLLERPSLSPALNTNKV